MKGKDIKALHQRSQLELRQEVVKLRTQLAKIRVEKKAKKLTNVALPSRLADDLARVQTVLRRQELES